MIVRLFVVILVLLSVGVLHAQGPENTMVVVNAESQDSLAVANRFIHLRNIPATNVVYLTGITHIEKFGDESSSSGRFQKEIGTPVMKAIKDRGLQRQIDCITYSADFPTRFSVQPQMKVYLKQRGLKYSIYRHAPWASITSLTYFYNDAFSDQPGFFDDRANRYSANLPKTRTQNPFTGELAKQFDDAQKMIRDADYSGAIETLRKLGNQNPDQMDVVIAFARASALNGDDETAIRTLVYAHSKGFHWRSRILNDKAFDGLKGNPKFDAIIAKISDFPSNVLPSRNFSASANWAENGWPNASTTGDGHRYFLSTMLAVTGDKERSSVDNALSQIERSISADGTHPKASVYFADHGDPRSKTRASQFQFAAKELKSIGKKSVVGKAKMPPKNERVIGVTLGSPVLDWKKSGSQFVPGALCDNFTSYGAWWQKAGQTQLNEFLDAGAAGACGTVYEPYTIATKIPTARLHAHYARGCTLAESFYQSVSCPFQLLIVGDPLCCPFGKFPQFEVKGLADGDTVSGDFILKIEPAAGSPPLESYEIYFDGVLLRKLTDTDELAVEINTINDGYHEIRVVGVGDSVVANRTSRAIGFVVNRDSQTLNLSISNTQFHLGGSVRIQVDSTFGKRVEIRQNFRKIALVDSEKEKRITASQIGLGKSKLQAVVVLDDGTLVRSMPVEVEILGH
jgi:hypothetical protein